MIFNISCSRDQSGRLDKVMEILSAFLLLHLCSKPKVTEYWHMRSKNPRGSESLARQFPECINSGPECTHISGVFNTRIHALLNYPHSNMGVFISFQILL